MRSQFFPPDIFPLFVLSVLVLSFLFSADLSRFRALKCFGRAESGENRHLQSFFLGLSHSTVLKNRKK